MRCGLLPGMRNAPRSWPQLWEYLVQREEPSIHGFERPTLFVQVNSNSGGEVRN